MYFILLKFMKRTKPVECLKMLSWAIPWFHGRIFWFSGIVSTTTNTLWIVNYNKRTRSIKCT